MAHARGIIATNLKVEIYFILPELSATKTVTWNCHVDDYAMGRNEMILGRDLFTALGLNLKLYDQVIETYYGPLKGSTAPIVNLGTNELKDLNTEKITPDESFTNAYA